MGELNEVMQVNPKAKQLIEKWSDRAKLVEDVMDQEMSYEKKYVLASCLENTQLALNLTEATN